LGELVNITSFKVGSAIFVKHVERKSISQPAPFMNKTLRNAVYKKRMTHNEFLKDKSNKNWEAYRKQRNLVTKLKKQSIRTYFYERCVGGPKSTDFYPTIKPFLTNKGSNITKDIILEDNNKIINDQLQVANNFNNFFINVAKDIGNDNNLSAEEHLSIKIIKENKKEIPKLIFHEIENDFVSKQIYKANSKKATGRDGISAKL
jgi:hypothetical protein